MKELFREWSFSPYNLEEWNNSQNRILLVAVEPNGDNPDGGVSDMGNWFRTANYQNKFHSNANFYNRCKIIINGILQSGNVSNWNHFKFLDLKATSGTSTVKEKEIRSYVSENIDAIIEHFLGDYAPHMAVLLGQKASNIFNKQIRQHIIKKGSVLKWVRMPHPTAMVRNDLFKEACSEINDRWVVINENSYEWYYNNIKNYGWRK